MKKTRLYILMILLLAAASSCTMQRRQHRPGFYVDRPWLQTTAPVKTAISPIAEAAAKETATEKRDPDHTIIAAPEEKTKEENSSPGIEAKARGKKAAGVSPVQDVRTADPATGKSAGEKKISAPRKSPRAPDEYPVHPAVAIGLAFVVAAPVLGLVALLMSTEALVWGLLLLALVLVIAGFVLSIVGMKRVKETSGMYSGKDLAVLGIGLAVVDLVVLFFLTLLGSLAILLN